MKPAKRLKADTVVDEQGRRRFHGAFTGGFSAGYFNTVGSAEGWKPQSFVSGRSARGQARKQSVLDFADAEDGLLGGSLEMQEQFNGRQGLTEGKDSMSAWLTGEMALPGPLVKDLIVAADRSIGVRLLQKMGWRSGHGVGARVPISEGAVHGGIAKAVIPIGAFDQLTGQVTKAPDDFRISIPPPKEDLHGLGFERKTQSRLSSGRDRRVAAYHVSDLFNKSSKVAIDSYVYDDEADAYGSHSKDLLDVDHYGKEEVPIEEEEVGMTRRQVADRWVSGPSQTNSQTCPSDGRPVLEGFTLASVLQPNEEVIPKIEVPASYSPCASLSEEMVPKPRQSRWSDAPQVKAPPLETTAEDPTPEEILKAARGAEERRNRFSGLSEAFRSRFVSASSKLASSSTNTDDKLRGLQSVVEFSAKMAESKQSDESGRADNKSKALEDVRRQGRTTVAWTPAPLLCKRFNVPVPTKSSHPPTATSVLPKDRGAELFEKHVGAYIAVPEKPRTESITSSSEADAASFLDDLLVSAAMSITVRPEMTMLRSIFDSDSEDEVDESVDRSTKWNDDAGPSKSAPVASDTQLEDRDVTADDSAAKFPYLVEDASFYLQKKYLHTDGMNDSLEESSQQSVASESKIIFKRPSRQMASSDPSITEHKGDSAKKGMIKSRRKNVLSFSFDD